MGYHCAKDAGQSYEGGGAQRGFRTMLLIYLLTNS